MLIKRLVSVSKAATTTEKLTGCFGAGVASLWGWNITQIGPINKQSHHHTSQQTLHSWSQSASFSIIHACDLCCSSAEGLFLLPAQQRLNTHYRPSLSLLSVPSARTTGASQAVAHANVDHIAGEEDGLMDFLLLLCSQDIRKRISTGHRKVNVSHCVCVWTSQREERESFFSFVYKKNYGCVASVSLA